MNVIAPAPHNYPALPYQHGGRYDSAVFVPTDGDVYAENNSQKPETYGVVSGRFWRNCATWAYVSPEIPKREDGEMSMSDRRFNGVRNGFLIFDFSGMIAAERKKTELKRKVSGFADLPDGWDGYYGEAPNGNDVRNAIDFLEKIPSHRFISAKPVVVGDGEVGFAWDIDNCHMEIIFVHGGAVFYSKTPAGKQHADEKQYSKHSPHVLMKFQDLMNKFFDNVN